MPIVIEFTENTRFKIQVWIMKITNKLYTHKTKKHKIIKIQKIKEVKMLNPNNKQKHNIWMLVKP
jgi:phage anti-repressor protein